MSDQKDREKVKSLIKSIKVCMFTTQDSNNELRTRPMNTTDVEKDGTLWFFTDAFSDKVDEFQENHPVSLGYSDPGNDDYVSVSGHATLVRDRETLEDKWNPMLKAWFPDGLDTKGISLIKVVPKTAEYWDGADNSLVQMAKIGYAILTGQKHQTGEHGRVQMS